MEYKRNLYRVPFAACGEQKLQKLSTTLRKEEYALFILSYKAYEFSPWSCQFFGNINILPMVHIMHNWKASNYSFIAVQA